MNTNKHLITVVGPTAIGKTSLAIKLANEFHTDVISSDSRQFYKEMSIGTAVPEKEELAQAKHHFIQHKSITDDYSVGDFEKEATLLLDQLLTTNNQVIMVGGSGLYNDAVIKGLDNFPDVTPEIRNQLNNQLKNDGIEVLQNELKKLDPEHFKKIDIHNPHRLIRALEICIGTGKPFSSFLNQKKIERKFKTIKIGLKAEREIIYDRINQRVDIMIQNGLLEEAKNLYGYRNLNALQTVGYKELFEYFDGNWTLDFAILEIKKNTRRFAKRQLTWLRKDENILWFDYTTNVSEIIQKINQKIHQ